MTYIERFLGSKPLQLFALIVSVLAGLLRIFDNAFPSQVQNAAKIFLFVAGGYICLVIVWWIVTRIRKRLGLRDNVPILDQQVYEHMAKRYGIGYDSLDVECKFDRNGVEIDRCLKLQAYSVVPQLDNTLFLKPDPGSTATPSPATIRSLDDSRKITIDRDRSSESIVVVQISPPLRQSEGTEFVLTEEVKGQFYATTISRAEQQRRSRESDRDFFAMRIDRPTRQLSIKVGFPRGITPMAFTYFVHFAPVSLGLPPREQHEEFKRIPAPILKSLTNGKSELSLVVDYPAVGLLYGLYWDPPVVEDPDLIE